MKLVGSVGEITADFWPEFTTEKMTIQQFAEMTINVLRKVGNDGYLPMFVFLDTQEILAIEEIPADVDHRDAIQNIIRRRGYKTREFYFGVQSAPQQITVGHFRPGLPTNFMTITETSDGYDTKPVSASAWWKL